MYKLLSNMHKARRSGLYDLEEARLDDPVVILGAIWQSTSCVAYPYHFLTQFLKQA